VSEEPVPVTPAAEKAAGPEGVQFRPTRRQAVIGTGVAMGAVVLASAPFLSGLVASLSRVLRPAVGVVAPPSARYPDLLEQLVSGVRRGLGTNGRIDAPVFARTAANSAPSSVATAARGLVEREKVDLVLVYGNPTQTDLLGALAKETGAAIVVVDPGANIVTSGDMEPRVLAHSLGHWQSVWSLGAWSAGALGPRTYVVSSLYESGFDILPAFEHGLTKAGGSVVGTSITHVKPGDAAVAARLAGASGADALFVAASGHEADEIIRAVAADAAAARMPLLVPGLSVDRLAVQSGLTAFTALTWPVGRRTAFEMLGEDVGTLVAKAVDGGRDALPAGDTTLSGARGRIGFDLASGRTDVPVRIHSASARGGSVALEPVAEERNTSSASAYADAILPAVRTGWLDVYGSTL
jgi:hypothetical protein